jgi:hypothetical protein
MLNKEAHRAFYRECHEAATKRGAADLNLLFVDGQPAAFSYCHHYRGQVAQLKTAYHPAFAIEGAGTVLQARVVADCLARGDQTMDLGQASMDWKRFWLTELRPISRYTHYPRGALIAQMVRGKRALERRFRNTLRGWNRKSSSSIPKVRSSPVQT